MRTARRLGPCWDVIPVPLDQFSTPFFSQIGVTSTTPVADVVSKLQNAGDAMLSAVIYHSDHLELSEQFDAVTGYEKSVRNCLFAASPRCTQAFC